MEIELPTVFFARQLQLTQQTFLVHTDSHGRQFHRTAQYRIPNQDVTIQSHEAIRVRCRPIIIVWSTTVMRLTIRQLSADTDNKDGSIGLGNQILTLLYGLVRIHTQQLLGMDEVNLLGQERLQLTVAFTNEELRTQDRSIDSLYDILQALQRAVFLPDNSLPVPLIHIERMQVVQFLVSTDSIHIGIDSVARLHIVFSQCQPFPFGQ